MRVPRTALIRFDSDMATGRWPARAPQRGRTDVVRPAVNT